MKRLLLTLTLVAATVAPALADPKGDLMNAMMKVARATSYHVQTTDKGKSIDMDMMPPTKMHIMMGSTMEMIKIDSEMYVKVQGTWRKFSIPGMDAMVNMYKGNIDKYTHAADDTVVTDIGMKVVDGAPLHGYTMKNAEAKTPVTIYIDGAGYPARMETDNGLVMLFSKFNAPMSIDAPI
jgi:hypothetical protein